MKSNKFIHFLCIHVQCVKLSSKVPSWSLQVSLFLSTHYKRISILVEHFWIPQTLSLHLHAIHPSQPIASVPVAFLFLISNLILYLAPQSSHSPTISVLVTPIHSLRMLPCIPLRSATLPSQAEFCPNPRVILRPQPLTLSPVYVSTFTSWALCLSLHTSGILNYLNLESTPVIYKNIFLTNVRTSKTAAGPSSLVHPSYPALTGCSETSLNPWMNGHMNESRNSHLHCYHILVRILSPTTNKEGNATGTAN